MKAILNPYGHGAAFHRPDGLGTKTTTRDSGSRGSIDGSNIMTGEDPVEYNLIGHQPDPVPQRDRDDVRGGAEAFLLRTPKSSWWADPRHRDPAA